MSQSPSSANSVALREQAVAPGRRSSVETCVRPRWLPASRVVCSPQTVIRRRVQNGTCSSCLEHHAASRFAAFVCLVPENYLLNLAITIPCENEARLRKDAYEGRLPGSEALVRLP